MAKNTWVGPRGALHAVSPDAEILCDCHGEPAYVHRNGFVYCYRRHSGGKPRRRDLEAKRAAIVPSGRRARSHRMALIA